MVALLGASIWVARADRPEPPPQLSARIVHRVMSNGIAAKPDPDSAARDPKGALRVVAAARGPHGHVVGVSLCKVQSPALHGARWWLVALDGVGNTPLGPGGGPTVRGVEVVVVDPANFKPAYSIDF